MTSIKLLPIINYISFPKYVFFFIHAMLLFNVPSITNRRSLISVRHPIYHTPFYLCLCRRASSAFIRVDRLFSEIADQNLSNFPNGLFVDEKSSGQLKRPLDPRDSY